MTDFKHIRGSEQIIDGTISTSLLNIDADLSFHENQALSIRLENLASNPSAGNVGRLIYRTDVNEVFVDNGSSFVPVATGADVSSIQIDSNTPLVGDIRFLSGANISLVQVGQTVTINSTGNLTSSDFIVGEDLTSQVNGSNVTFTLANTPIVNKESFYLNGVKLRRGIGNDYTLTGAVATFASAPFVGDVVTADYIK